MSKFFCLDNFFFSKIIMMDAGVRLDQLRKRCYRNKDNVLLNISLMNSFVLALCIALQNMYQF